MQIFYLNDFPYVFDLDMHIIYIMAWMRRVPLE